MTDTIADFNAFRARMNDVILGAGIDFVTIADWVLSLVMLTATWGYALQRRFGAVAYWKSAFWIELFATAVMLIPVLLGTLALLVRTVTSPRRNTSQATFSIKRAA